MMTKEERKIYNKNYYKKNFTSIKEKRKFFYFSNHKERLNKEKKIRKKTRSYHINYMKDWNKNNSEIIRKSHLKYKYGITLEEYDLLFIKQNGVCAICNKPETSKNKNNIVSSMSIDHCHKTGKIRGLLCNKCNRGIGYLQDDINILTSAINYLTQY